MASKPPTVVELVWNDRLEFSATLPHTSLVIDSSGTAGPSPVQLLGTALAGCMSIDLAHILNRGRHPFTALRSKLVAERGGYDLLPEMGYKPVNKYLPPRPRRDAHTAKAEALPKPDGSAFDRLFVWADKLLSSKRVVGRSPM